MRSNAGTLNSQLSRVFSELGHTDQLVITDAGLPIPKPVERVDLALAEGVPGFLQVLDQTLAEIVIEGALAPAEIEDKSPEMLAALRTRFDRLGVELTLVPHEEFKRRSGNARAAVRSGEFTPYANVILTCGVAY
ncbi:MAG: D-ribose pyranase [Actinomycetota bacterium]